MSKKEEGIKLFVSNIDLLFECPRDRKTVPETKRKAKRCLMSNFHVAYMLEFTWGRGALGDSRLSQSYEIERYDLNLTSLSAATYFLRRYFLFRTLHTVAHKGHIDFFRRKLLTCDRNLITYDRNLLTCDRNLLTCDRNLLTCDRNLLTCDRNSLTCDRNLLTCDRNLLTCDRNSLTCDRNLLTCDRNLLTCDRNLLTCDRNLIIGDHNLLTCNRSRSQRWLVVSCSFVSL